MLVNLDMEHNHNPLIYGFLLSFSMVGLGVSMAFFSKDASDFLSYAVLTIVALLLLVAGIIMLRGTFKTRDECSICKEKYHFGKK